MKIKSMVPMILVVALFATVAHAALVGELKIISYNEDTQIARLKVGTITRDYHCVRPIDYERLDLYKGKQVILYNHKALINDLWEFVYDGVELYLGGDGPGGDEPDGPSVLQHQRILP